MIFAEFLVLLALLGGTGFGGYFLLSRFKKNQLKTDRKFDDLREALRSNNYKKIDDWMILYGHTTGGPLREHIQSRRDELYLEKNP